MRACMRLQAVRGGERLGAGGLLARVRTLPGMRAIVRLQVMGSSERFAAAALFTSMNGGCL